MVSGDFDEDGAADLAIGYSSNQGGTIAVLRGNLDALAPQTQASWQAAGRHENVEPFLPASQTIQLKSAPSLMVSADVNGDGHLDLVYASRGGAQLQVLFGTGHGTFLPQSASITISGSITALAAYRPGAPITGEALIVGYESSQGARVGILSEGAAGLSMNATYPLPSAATVLSVANLDDDFIPDVAIVAGGQLLVLHGSSAITGGGQLETLPVGDVKTVTSGEFLFDRHAQLQLAALTSDGSVLILAHQGYDPRPYTPQQIAAARHKKLSMTLAQQAGNTGNEPWTVVETDAGAGAYSSDSDAPILLRSRMSGSGGDDLVALNSAQQQRVVISHSVATSQAPVSAPGRVTVQNIDADSLVAALSMRVSADGRPGLVVLKATHPSPEVTLPSAGNTFYVNVPADNTGTSTDPSDGNRCTSGSGEVCTLRDAVTFVNNDATDNIAGGKSDTIMVPSGTYTLTWQAGTLDANGNALTHLEILGPVTIVGSTSGAGVVIDAASHDTVFTINPGNVGSFNPSGNSYVFDTTLENLVIENGKNVDNPGTNDSGLTNDYSGCINWDAFGTGNLTLTNTSVENCSIIWGAGGGIWAFNSAGGGTGTLTLTGGTISGNSTSEQGGGVYMGYAPTGLSATNTVFTGNRAQISVNPSDPGGAADVDDGGGLFLIARGSATPQTSLSGVTISNNIADGEGGGINTTTGIVLSTSTVTGNTSGSQGGGVYLEIGPPEVGVTITNTNIQTNSAPTTGGAVHVGNDNPSSGDSLQMTLGRIFGNTSTSGTNGLSVQPPGTVAATENWWGCNAGPTTTTDGCDQAAFYESSTGTLVTSPNLVLSLGVSPNPGTINTAIQLNGAVNTDSGGNAVTVAPSALLGESVAYTASVGSFSASVSGAINSSGIGSTSVTPTSSGTGSASATLDNQTVSTRFTVDGTTGHLVVSAPATTVAGTSFNFSVTAEDSGGNTLTGYTGTVHFTSSDGAAVLPVNATLTNGVGTFSATLKTAGTQTITATDTVTSSITGTSQAIDVGPGALTHFSITGPNSAPFYSDFPITITALDAFGNTESGFSGSVALSSSDPGFVNTSTAPNGYVSLTNGTGTINVALKTAGSDSITATDTANSSITGTAFFTVYPGPATQLKIVGPTSALSGTAFPVTLTAYDLYGNVATGYTGTVHFTSSDPNATLPVNSPVTGGTGLFNVTLNTAGTQTVTATDTVNAALTVTSGPITVTTPGFVVTTISDDTSGNAANCPVGGPSGGNGSDCSLRDALKAAGVAGAGNITFSPTAFATPQSIMLGTGGTLNIPANTTITGPGANLLTVSGANTYQIFTAGSGITASISGLTLINGVTTSQGGAIYDSGTLTVSNSVFTGNTAGVNGGAVATAGAPAILTLAGCSFSNNSSTGNGGALNNGPGSTITVTGTTFSGNTAHVSGGAIGSSGTLTLINSTITGNAASTVRGGGIYNTQGAALTLTNTTLTGNTANTFGGGIYINSGTVTLANSIVAGNTSSGSYADVDGNYSDHGGNVASNNAGATSTITPNLALLANYGGSTQTLLPLPGSPAICAGTAANATGLTTDQRGLPRTVTYSATSCVDAGAVQTNYAISFTTQPPATATVNQPLAPAPVVQLTESGQVATAATSPIAMSDAASALGGTLSVNFAAGSATFSNLVFNAAATNDTLTATLPMNASLATPLFLTVQASIPVTATAQVTPTITWATPAAITYGTALSATQLDASSTVAGSFTYSPTIGTVLTAGPQKLSVTFTPTDTTDYSTATASVILQVNQATPTITWATPAAITYGTQLSATQLDASSTVAGSFTYSPAAGAVLTAGPQKLSVTFTPTDTTDYSTATASVTLQVNQATPAITWATPTAITYGTQLSATQLDASSTVAGSFTYSPVAGAVLSAGPQKLSVTFTPTDTTDYSTATSSVTLQVNQATPAITWATPAAITYGTQLSATQLDASSTVAGTFTYSPAAGAVLKVGPQRLSVTFTPSDATDYSTATASVTLQVNQGTPAITWATPAAITYGTQLSATQLDASSTVAGSLTYSPVAGAVLTAGPQKLSVSFTPTDTADYSTATASVTLQVNQATPAITWATPAPIAFNTALSATQLDASSTVAGSFTYSPMVGAVLTPGPQKLSVSFTPTDTADYTSATASVTLTVNSDSQTISFSAGTRGYASGVTFGTAPLTLGATSTSGLPVTFSLLSGPAVLSGNTLTINGAGAVVIAANQAGNSNYSAAPQVTESILVNKALPSATLTSSLNPALAQNGITLTATVTSGAGTPSGTVTFLDGTTPLGTATLSAAGLATFSTSSLADGSHSITAAYGGDANFLAGSSSPLSQLVEDFGFTISSPTAVALPGHAAVFTFTVSPISATAFPAAITLTANGLPPGATYTFSPATLTPGEGATTVTLTVDIPRTQAGVNPADLHPNVQLTTGSSGNASSSGSRNTRIVSRLAPFTLAFILLPFGGRPRRAGRRLSRAMSLVLLLAMGIAALAGLGGCGGGFFAQQQQNYTVTVTGTSGALSHSATVSLTVE